LSVERELEELGGKVEGRGEDDGFWVRCCFFSVVFGVERGEEGPSGMGGRRMGDFCRRRRSMGMGEEGSEMVLKRIVQPAGLRWILYERRASWGGRRRRGSGCWVDAKLIIGV
jgi:hypothetical protein